MMNNRRSLPLRGRLGGLGLVVSGGGDVGYSACQVARLFGRYYRGLGSDGPSSVIARRHWITSSVPTSDQHSSPATLFEIPSR